MFHVPEDRRVDLPLSHALSSTIASGNNGAFDFVGPVPGWRLLVIASDGGGWEHVSVHAARERGLRDVQTRVPTWAEMVFIKNEFWGPEDVVMQLHPRQSVYVNQHPHVLHLWRPLDKVIPEPPPEFVGQIAKLAGHHVELTPEP